MHLPLVYNIVLFFFFFGNNYIILIVDFAQNHQFWRQSLSNLMRSVQTHSFGKPRWPTHNYLPETCRRSLGCLFLFVFFFQRENVRVVQQNIRPRHIQVPVEDPEIFRTLRGRTGEQSVTSLRYFVEPTSIETRLLLFFIIKRFLFRLPPSRHTQIRFFFCNDFLLLLFFFFSCTYT